MESKTAETILAAFERDGFCIAPNVLDSSRRREFLNVMAQIDSAQSRRDDAVYGARNLLANPWIRTLAQSPAIRAVTERIIGPSACAVRGLFFDKTPEANWHVPWHQDLVIAVAERCDMPDWGPWTIKAGVHHVEAPVALLSRMLTLRLHIDDCDDDNGPLCLLPGTHRLGRLKNAEIKQARADVSSHVCLAPAGAVLAMRPLLVHASAKAKQPGHRRVLHLEFAPDDLLPPPLAWMN